MEGSANYHHNTKKDLCLFMAVVAAVIVGMLGCRSMSQPSRTAPALDRQEDGSTIVARINGQSLTYDVLARQHDEDGSDLPFEESDTLAPMQAVEAGRQDSDSPFPTFKETGHATCVDDRGNPIILLFSASSCSHCQWVSGVFNLVAREYADKGLVVAYHYDVETGDDLLTEAVETQIPDTHLSIGKQGDPDGYMPYFNFGCRYDRIGTGYEEENDLSAEAEEMCRVIEALLP